MDSYGFDRSQNMISLPTKLFSGSSSKTQVSFFSAAPPQKKSRMCDLGIPSSIWLYLTSCCFCTRGEGIHATLYCFAAAPRLSFRGRGKDSRYPFGLFSPLPAADFSYGSTKGSRWPYMYMFPLLHRICAYVHL